MIYKESDYFASYSTPAICPKMRRFRKYISPEIRALTGGEPVTLRLGYHPSQIKRYTENRAKEIVGMCEYAGKPLSASDVVVIIGGAFNWLGEGLEDLVPGLQSWSVDPSDFVQANKNKSPDEYLRKMIDNAGYAGTPVGDYFFKLFQDPKPFSRNGTRIVASIDAIPEAIKPTVIISEDCWQAMLDAEKLPIRQRADELGLEILHFIEGQWH